MSPKITRRQYLKSSIFAGLAAAIGYPAFRKGREVGRSLNKPSNSSEIPVKIIPKEKLKKPVPQKQEKPKQRNLLAYTPGLSGEALARVYGVKFTNSWKFAPNKKLLHDIKVLLAVECEKYNQRGTVVDPYQLFSIFSKEANFNPNAIGGAGERGIAQLKDSVLSDLAKLKQNAVRVTDPFDLKQGISAAVRHAVWLHENLSTKTLFRKYAAWNQGIGAAGNKKHKRWGQGNKYANDAWARHQKYRKAGVLNGYI